jgi:hypothetical protein
MSETFRGASSFLPVLFVCVFMLTGAGLLAHEMTVKGIVVSVEETRIQVKNAEDSGGGAAEWYLISEGTAIKRGGRQVTLAEARIRVDERIVLIVEHPEKGPMVTKEIRLAAR